MRVLLLLLRTSRWDAITGILAGAATGLATSGFAWILQAVIARRGENWHLYAVAFAGCWLVYGAGAVLADNRLTRVAQRAVRELRLSVSRRILAVPLPVLEREQNRIFPVLVEDIAAISRAAERLPTVISGLVTVIGCFVLLTVVSWQLAVACLVLVALALGGYVLPLHRFQKHLARWRADWDGISTLLDAIVRGHKELLQDDRKRSVFFDRHLEPVCRRQEVELTRANTWETLVKRWGELLLLLGVGLLLFTLPLHGWATHEQFGRFLFIALFMLAPLSNLVGFSTYLSRVALAMDRAEQIGIVLGQDDPASATPPAHRTDTPTPNPAAIQFGLREVSYRHSRDDAAPFDLGPVSLTFDRAEVVFVCGGNGSGKTTLLKLICGLYPPSHGELVSAGRTVDDAALAGHRRRFGVIFADFFLFSSLLGYEDAPAAAAQKLLKDVHLEKLVSIGADGAFSTTKLSQGQRKRLALVATLLEDKPVYVFDEWAADQDPEFRRWFYEHILPGLRARGKLVIAITHDDAFYPTADRIVRLSEGRIVSDTRQTAVS
ncbi:cyclic peptide export ABC transporter [Rariglobus hedericola]|uniref:Cyclic peptide export ABC transporter n=1 Tax=Rariglobus hedericola TaxID=2597822 RepID=A0A556QQV4_9BACT|nr:cyclic peptide export ABC transporter [Rariglobus hedericola]TSJ79012.1 cyclic peptide export ABC transporter [Rariglobus hedericola]